MEWGIAILVVGVGVLGYLYQRSLKKQTEYRVKFDDIELEKQIIEENRKAKAANIHMVNNLPEPERSKLREKWTRK